MAYIVPYSLNFPPANIQTMSPSTWVTWSPTGWTASMRQGNPDNSVTAWVNKDVGLTPYWIQVYLEHDNADGTAVTGTRLASCGSGISCVVDKDKLPGVGTLVAFVNDSATTSFPPTGIQATATLSYMFFACPPPGGPPPPCN